MSSQSFKYKEFLLCCGSLSACLISMKWQLKLVNFQRTQKFISLFMFNKCFNNLNKPKLKKVI